MQSVFSSVFQLVICENAFSIVSIVFSVMFVSVYAVFFPTKKQPIEKVASVAMYNIFFFMGFTPYSFRMD